MGKIKYDGVVEAVHYTPEGQVDWVRVFLRRGPTFSDRILIDRQTLISHLKAGKKYLAGARVPLMGGTFETSQPLRLLVENGQELLGVGEVKTSQDYLEGVPQV